MDLVKVTMFQLHLLLNMASVSKVETSMKLVYLSLNQLGCPLSVQFVLGLEMDNRSGPRLR